MTKAGDLERFDLLVRSLDAVNCDLDHLVVVDTEDLDLFRRFERPNRFITPTSTLLPPRLERLRVGYRRLDPRARLRPARGKSRKINGWYAQQLVKLAAVEAADDYRALLIVDSDLVAIRPVDLRAQLDVQDPVLFATVDTDAEMASWVIQAMDFLGVQLQRTPLHRYTFEPVLMYPAIVRALKDHLESTHGGPWLDTILRANLKEYSLYGVFLEYSSHGPRPHLHPPVPTVRVCFEEEYERLLEVGLSAVEPADAVFVVIHSRLRRAPEEYERVLDLGPRSDGA